MSGPEVCSTFRNPPRGESCRVSSGASASSRLPCLPVVMAANKMFVAVTDSGHFHVGGKPFFFAGANCYYLMVRDMPSS